MISALNVGNNILQRGFEEDIDITPMKLQKLIYLVYKQYYKENKKSLFAEPFEVWRYGPVVRSVYDVFKEYRSNRISKYAAESNGSVLIVDETKSLAFKSALDYVWNKYKYYDGIPLSEMTHRQGTAWWKAAKDGEQYLKNSDIEQEVDFV